MGGPLLFRPANHAVGRPLSSDVGPPAFLVTVNGPLHLSCRVRAHATSSAGLAFAPVPQFGRRASGTHGWDFIRPMEKKKRDESHREARWVEVKEFLFLNFPLLLPHFLLLPHLLLLLHFPVHLAPQPIVVA